MQVKLLLKICQRCGAVLRAPRSECPHCGCQFSYNKPTSFPALESSKLIATSIDPHMADPMLLERVLTRSQTDRLVSLSPCRKGKCIHEVDSEEGDSKKNEEKSKSGSGTEPSGSTEHKGPVPISSAVPIQIHQGYAPTTVPDSVQNSVAIPVPETSTVPIHTTPMQKPRASQTALPAQIKEQPKEQPLPVTVSEPTENVVDAPVSPQESDSQEKISRPQLSVVSIAIGPSFDERVVSERPKKKKKDSSPGSPQANPFNFSFSQGDTKFDVPKFDSEDRDDSGADIVFPPYELIAGITSGTTPTASPISPIDVDLSVAFPIHDAQDTPKSICQLLKDFTVAKLQSAIAGDVLLLQGVSIDVPGVVNSGCLFLMLKPMTTDKKFSAGGQIEHIFWLSKSSAVQ
ncbi:MAG: hypothetical protein K2Z81_13275, partial [Cyanobacteria bacterium]|nr:hypothetical protein [Cyanobacteriota bacterium]